MCLDLQSGKSIITDSSHESRRKLPFCDRISDGQENNMNEIFERTALLLGEDGLNQLQNARVAVFGVGGVGGYVVEALARGGIGALDLIDDDIVAPSNINRQIIATHSTVGRPKVEVARDRVLDINPDCQVNCHQLFYLPETAAQFDMRDYDYVVDAIDTVSGKLMLAEQAAKAGTPMIAAMGAGNKLDPTGFRVADISRTKGCPLARVMRRELKKRGITKLKVVYSEEEPVTPAVPLEDTEISPSAHPKRRTPGSVSFVPSVMGLIIAGEVIKDICNHNEKGERV